MGIKLCNQCQATWDMARVYLAVLITLSALIAIIQIMHDSGSLEANEKLKEQYNSLFAHCSQMQYQNCQCGNITDLMSDIHE